MWKDIKSYVIFTAQETTGANGKQIYTGNSRPIKIVLTADNSFAWTVKVQESITEDIDFTAATGSSNQWSYAGLKDDEEPSSSYDGNEGIVYTGAEDWTRTFSVDTDLLYWVTVNVTARAAGDITATVLLWDNG